MLYPFALLTVNGLGAIHMVNAFATENGVSLGQRKVFEKRKEVTAIPEFLNLIDI